MPVARFQFRYDPRSTAAVKAALDGVKFGVTNRVVKAAVAKQSRIAAKEAKQDAPRGPSGNLKRSIGVKFRSYKAAQVWVFAVGPRTHFEDVHPAVGPNGQIVYRKTVATKIAHLAEGGRRGVGVVKAKWLAFVTVRGNARAKRARKPDRVVYAKKVRAAHAFRFVERAYQRLVTRTGQIETDIVAGIKREAAKYAAKGKSIYA